MDEGDKRMLWIEHMHREKRPLVNSVKDQIYMRTGKAPEGFEVQEVLRGLKQAVIGHPLSPAAEWAAKELGLPISPTQSIMTQ